MADEPFSSYSAQPSFARLRATYWTEGCPRRVTRDSLTKTGLYLLMPGRLPYRSWAGDRKPGYSDSDDRNIYGVVASSARGMGRGFLSCLGFSLAVSGAHLEGVVARLRIPVIDILAPSVHGKLVGKLRLVPGLAVVGRDLNTLYPAVRSPSDAAYRHAASGYPVSVFYGVDTGLGLDRAFLRPRSLDPVSVKVPVCKLYLCEPLSSRDVAV